MQSTAPTNQPTNLLCTFRQKEAAAFRREGSGSDGLNWGPNHCPLAVAIHRWPTITSSKALSSCHCKPHWEQWQVPTVPSLADGSQAGLDESQADKQTQHTRHRGQHTPCFFIHPHINTHDRPLMPHADIHHAKLQACSTGDSSISRSLIVE